MGQKRDLQVLGNVCLHQWRCLCVIVRQVTGLDGNYRITCHTVMEVLREHRDSVMAVLEAFVYDPLLNWRLMDSKRPLAEQQQPP